MKMLLRGMDYVVDYVDIPTWEDNIRSLRDLFRRLQRANVTVRPTKYVLGARTINFLGHRLGEGTFRMRTLRPRPSPGASEVGDGTRGPLQVTGTYGAMWPAAGNHSYEPAQICVRTGAGWDNLDSVLNH
ncbi:Zinc finger protein [Plakobranchus ocellatus]|uniref:Zinc finger protein n=1 Tax=Plakobranchus ocellatus TaxID=259542 RepID=A0AAV3Y9C4_9GAST|nr:Zinc finger protein [Plakobranchus ocellatus]